MFHPASQELQLKENSAGPVSFVAKLGGNYTIGGDTSNTFKQNVTVFPRYAFSEGDTENTMYYMIGFAKWNASLSFEMDPVFEVMGAPFPLEKSPEVPSGIDGSSVLMMIIVSTITIPLLITKLKKKYNLHY